MTRVLRGLASLGLLAGLLLGLPAVLIALGPPRIPWTRLPTALLRPDDGTLALAAVQLLAWLVWAVLAAAIALEVVAAVRRVPTRSLRGLALPQHAARALVSSALALFLGASILGSPAALATPTRAPAPVGARVDPTTPAHGAPATRGSSSGTSVRAASHTEATTPRTPTYTVKRGDSLWRIAQRHLGSGQRYPEIVALNKALLKGKPDFLLPGWTLKLPVEATAAASEPVAGRGTSTIPPPNVPTEEPVPDAPPAATTPRAEATPAPAADASHTGPAPASAERAPSASVASSAAPDADAGVDDPVEDDTPLQAPWLVAGLSGAGALLCGGLALQLRRRRREQARHRRPGRTVPPLPAEVAPIEKTIIAHGDQVATLETLDRVLRGLAAHLVAEHVPLPRLAAVELGGGTITLHLRTTASGLPNPWVGESDGLRWRLAASDADPAQPTMLFAPWPQLVAIGADADDHAWLLNLEEAGVVRLVGDQTFAEDLARYAVAELAVNPWAREVRVDCLNTCPELVAWEPARVTHHTDDEVLRFVTRDATDVVERLTSEGGSGLADARAAGLGDDLWPSRALVCGDTTPGGQLGALVSVVNTHPGGTGTSVILLGPGHDSEAAAGLELRLTEDGRLLLPALGLELTPVGLTEAEAGGCGDLLACADRDVADDEIATRHEPGDEPWQAHCDEAGQLVDERLLDRSTPAWPAGASSVLPAPDEDYLEVAATTADDLAELAPVVPAEVRTEVEDDDPDLDADLAEWRSKDGLRPRLILLGPLSSRTGRGGKALAITKRKPYFTELLAFLATGNGVTTDQVAEAMGISTERVRKDAAVLRDWLGIDPRTGEPHLPPANRNRTSQARGTGIYEVHGLLCDADLFRRLRVRGEARGEKGHDDLRAALTLVTGQPFDGFRDRSGSWLVGTALPQHFVCGIVDVAHLVTLVSLHRGDLSVARAAAELALLAAPHEEIPRLDLAAVAAAEGHRHEAARIVRTHVLDPFEDEAPTELSRRTQAILQRHAWLTVKAS